MSEYDQKEIPQKVRDFVYKRDNYRCRRCGREDGLTIHHIEKRSLGGDHNPKFLITLCWEPCHRLAEDHCFEIRRIKGQWFFSG